MIREPYNINPYNSAKDLSDTSQFSFTFGGDALIGYDYKIQDNANKNNIIKDWSYKGNNYIPTLESGRYSSATTALDEPTILYNDEDYYFKVNKINNSNYYNNKGFVWQLRLFEDNTNPSNIIQSGEITDVLSLNASGSTVKGTITGLLETSDSYIFSYPGYTEHWWNDQEGQSYKGKIPDRWTRNVMKIGNYSFPIDDYETHMEQYFSTSKPDTYYIATGLKTSGISESYYIPVLQYKKCVYQYSGTSSLTIKPQTSSTTLIRSNFSGIQKSAIVKSGSNISSVTDRVTGRDLFNAKTNNKSISYSLGSTSLDIKTSSSGGVITSTASTYNVLWGNTGNIVNSKLYYFTITENITEYNSSGEPIIYETFINGSRSTLGLGKLQYIDPSTGTYRSIDDRLLPNEITQLRNQGAISSTILNLTNSKTYETITENEINFDTSNESLIYTVELSDNKIKYNVSTTQTTSLTRAMAKSKGLITSSDSNLIIKSLADDSVETSDKFFTYDEISNFKDNDYGLYYITKGLSDDKVNEVDVTTVLSSTGSLKNKEIYFTILNNYYDSNYYYFTNQIQPDIYFSVDDTPYYSYNNYIEQVESGNKPTITEPGLPNKFLFQKNDSSILVLDIDQTLGTESNPLVTLQRFFPLVTSLAGLSYNFKYYTYKIFGGILEKDGFFIYDTEPVFASEKIFSRNIRIDYNNYVTDYDRYKIQLTLVTTENGSYNYYTFLYPTIDMFQNDEKDDRFAFVSYDQMKGAAKISWTKDNAYPPVTKDTTITTYGTYKVEGKLFPLTAYEVEDEGYISYYHKGSQLLNINPLHDFQVSFTINKKVKNLEKISINPLIAFYNTQNKLSIQLKIENNLFKLFENNITTTSNNVYLIEQKGSLINLDNSTEENLNQIYQYSIPSTGNLSISGKIAPIEQDLKKYCFHFYLFPWSTSSAAQAFSSYKITRFYNANSEATNDLILKSEDDWRLGFYGEGAGNNADLGEGGNLPSGPDKANYDTSKFLSASYLLSGGRPSNQLFIGLSKITLYGSALYYGILDVNRRGLISSEDNFILNFNDSSVGFSSLDRQVYRYRIFRNTYENDDVNYRDASMEFLRQLDEIFRVNCGGITQNDSNHSTINSYNDIIDSTTYVTGWEGENGDIPLGYITGSQIKENINRSFDSLRKQMDNYFIDKNLSINFQTEDYGIIYNVLNDIKTPDMINNEMIAEINILDQSISEENGFFVSYDYNIPNLGYYRYQIIPMLRDKTYNVLIAKKNDLGESVIKIDDEYWHMTNISKRDDGSYAPDYTWNFILGVQSAPYTQNFTKTLQTGFAPYPKIMTSMVNYKTTNFVGYLGHFNFGSNGSINTYQDTIDIIEKWNKFAYQNNQILIKDPKGHVFIGAISATQDTSDITISDMPTQVSCQIVQIGDTSEYKVYSL